MTLEIYYLTSLSIAATLFAIMTLIGIVVAIWFSIRTHRLFNKLEILTDTTNAMAQDVKSFVQTTTDRLLTLERLFLTAEGLKKVASSFAEAFHHHKSTNKK